MKFYYRDEQLQELTELQVQSNETSKMAVLLGRRRIGKTSLAMEFVKETKSVYLFIAKKSETLLCESFVAEIKNKLNISIHGKIESFKEIFKLLLEYTKTNSLTLIVDEFQEFFNINPAVYSDIQELWDLHKNQSRLLVIFIGSVYSLMHKIFENEKEPLFGRADRMIHLRPFSIEQTYFILNDYGIKDIETLFEFYVVTGCVPKYLDMLLTNKCSDINSMLDFMLKENSPFLNEGRNQLIEEFGKDYLIYFSILELIARGKTSSSEIQSIIHKNVTSYLDKLESVYRVIRKFRPIDAKPNAKLVRYQIIDNFLQFWFRFFHRNRNALEIHNYEYVKEIIKQGFRSYSGKVMEKMFVELLAASKQFNRIGTYWEKGHRDEIDIVAINDMKKVIVAAEVKRNAKKNSQARLEHRASNLLKHYADYNIQYLRLSLEDAKKFLEAE